MDHTQESQRSSVVDGHAASVLIRLYPLIMLVSAAAAAAAAAATAAAGVGVGGVAFGVVVVVVAVCSVYVGRLVGLCCRCATSWTRQSSSTRGATAQAAGRRPAVSESSG